MNKDIRGWRGFSLLELLITLVLLAMLSVGGLHGWTTYRQTLRLEQQVQQTLAYLLRVQASAYWYNETRHISVIQEGDRWCLQPGISAGLRCEQALNGRFLPEAQDVRLAASSSRTLAFHGMRNSAQTGHLALENAAGRIRLVISVWGRMRLCSDTQVILGLPLC